MQFQWLLLVLLDAETPEIQRGGASDSSDGGSDAPVEYGSGEIKIWVADNTLDFTKSQAEAFIAANPDMSGYTITVEAVGEGEAAGNMITDVEGGADIFAFAQDQVARLVASGALAPITGDAAEVIKNSHVEGAVQAVTVGDLIYAYPMTWDNTYYLYYDKSVVTDPSSLEQILADCEAAGKNFYMSLGDGWYLPSFFFATGCKLEYETDVEGKYTACNIDVASDNGLVALKEMIDMASSSAYQQGANVDDAVNWGAIVTGVWCDGSAKTVLGENYACCKLPSFTGSDGNTYQLTSFMGCKLFGVKPQTDAGKLAVCRALAEYLTSKDVELARFAEYAWVPSNKEAQADSSVQTSESSVAINDQGQYTIVQGQYPGDYWTLGEAFGNDVANKVITGSMSDDELKAKLQEFQDTCMSYAQ
ncbi:MAG: extracellular solute-binding protein [Butyrivibrio sp.]|nr:extracellular solute-binding protein [Butyrivibrio sp.]